MYIFRVIHLESSLLYCHGYCFFITFYTPTFCTYYTIMYSHCYIILVSYQNPQPPSPPTRDARMRITTLPGGRPLEKCSECDIRALFLCSGCRKVWYCSANCQVGTSPTPPLHIHITPVADPTFHMGGGANTKKSSYSAKIFENSMKLRNGGLRNHHHTRGLCEQTQGPSNGL